jgi:uncharacterized protein (TIGR01777 family)
VSELRVTVTGATGLIGPRLVRALQGRGDEVTVLTRDPDRARRVLGDVQAFPWDLLNEPAPADALAGRNAVVHLAGANVAQRWSENAKRAIRETRIVGTGNLIEGLRAAEPRPATLLSSSAIGYYGAHGEEPLDEDAAAGNDFLAGVCVEWERQARSAQELGMRSVQVRTGVVLDGSGGALGKMLPPFRMGVGGAVAGGRQFISWIHADDVIGIMLAAIDEERWSGPVNATAPEPLSNRDFAHVLGRVLHRPAVLPVPGFALRLLYGDMAEIVTTGARVMPAKALVLGYTFAQPELEPALASAIG